MNKLTGDFIFLAAFKQEHLNNDNNNNQNYNENRENGAKHNPIGDGDQLKDILNKLHDNQQEAEVQNQNNRFQGDHLVNNLHGNQREVEIQNQNNRFQENHLRNNNNNIGDEYIDQSEIERPDYNNNNEEPQDGGDLER